MHNFINCNLVNVDRIWSGRSPFWLMLWPFSLLYGVLTYLIRLSFQRGWRKSWRASCPVIVVGNLTAGGNGKTPVVIWLVQALKQRGLCAGVVSRGYGGKAKCYPLLVTSDTSTEQAGDEPVLIAQRTQVAVAVAPQRRLAVEALLAAYDLDVIITDDGLQHYALQRDREIVIVDGIRRFGNGWWLPAGPMRERASRLREVDAVIINGGDTQDNEISMTLRPGLAINLMTGKTLPLDQLPPIVAMAGIGHPARFFNTIKQQGVKPVAEISFTDHQSYSAATLISLTHANQCLLITEKDAVKYRSFAHHNWWYLPVDADLQGNRVSKLLDDILQLCTHDVHVAHAG